MVERFPLRGFHRYGFASPEPPPSGDRNLWDSSQGNRKGINREEHHSTDEQEERDIEQLKRKKQLQFAEENLVELRERKDKEKEEKLQENIKDLEMIKSYYPWGREGGGAPRYTTSGTVLAYRKRMGLDTPTKRDLDERAYYPFGKPGGGAPRRRDSGSIITTLLRDPNIRFQKQLKKEADSLRYRLGDEEKPLTTPIQLKKTDSEIERLKKEQLNKMIYAKQLERQIKEKDVIPNEATSFQPYFPWGKDYPSRNISGKIIPRRRKNDREEERLFSDNGGWLKGLGEKTVHPAIVKDNNAKIYNPWGRPGCGAPLTSNNGEKVANVFGNFERQRTKSQQKRKFDEEDKDEDKISFVSWIRRGHVGQPKRDEETGAIIGQGKRTSDITSKKCDVRKASIAGDIVPYYSFSDRDQETCANNT